MKLTQPLNLKMVAFCIGLVVVHFAGNSPVLNAETASAKATFAGGCFWCMEKPFDDIDGVLMTTSGYTGGELPDPSYEEVSSGRTGHIEVVQVEYDPSKVTYAQLLDVFWKNVDPFDAGGQFCDRGQQYISAVFYSNTTQQTLALEAKKSISDEFNKSVKTKIEPLTLFYPAEAYHQNYYEENPIRYKFYRFNCQRDDRLNELW